MNLYINRTGKDWTTMEEFSRDYDKSTPYPDRKNPKAWIKAYRKWEAKNAVFILHKAWGIYYWITENLASMKEGQDDPDIRFGEIGEAEYNQLLETCKTALTTRTIPEGMEYKDMDEYEPCFWGHIEYAVKKLTYWKSRIDWTKEKIYFYSHP